MPYIKQERRAKLGTAMEYGDIDAINGPGELNYLITIFVQDFLGDHPNYEKYNAAIGVLESAKLELYRRKIAPYEDQKIKENGDVYKLMVSKKTSSRGDIIYEGVYSRPHAGHPRVQLPRLLRRRGEIKC